MYPDRAIEHSFGGTRLHGDRHTLDDFTGVCSDHMNAQYFVGMTINYHLHHGAFFVPGQCMFQPFER